MTILGVPQNSTAPLVEDRISMLPNPILLHILTLLPLRTAIQTSCLSKHWAWLWTSMPNLSFDELNHPTSRKSPTFASFVDNTLMLYNSDTIYRFSIRQYSCGGSKLPIWLRFALNRAVKDLELKLPYCVIELPLHICFSSSIVKLSLHCGPVLIPKSVYWPSLKCLVLRATVLNDKMTKILLAGCPVLEELVIKICLTSKVLDVSSLVNLKKLVVELAYKKGYHDHFKCVYGDDDDDDDDDDVDYDDDDDEEEDDDDVDYDDDEEEDDDANVEDDYADVDHDGSGDDDEEEDEDGDVEDDYADVHNDGGGGDDEADGDWSEHDGGSTFKICGSNLQSLVIVGNLLKRKLDLENLLSVTEAKVVFDSCCRHVSRNIIASNQLGDIISGICHVEELSLCGWALETLSYLKDNITTFSLLRLRNLVITTHFSVRDVIGLALMLQSSPNLETLVIQLEDCRAVRCRYTWMGNYWISQDVGAYNCLSHHLKMVKIVDFGRHHCLDEHSFEFFEFLLNNALVLEKMSIVCQNSRQSQLAMALMNVPSSSSSPSINITFAGKCKSPNST